MPNSSLYNYENKQFNEWTIIKELGSGKVLCRCSCGTEKIQVKYNVTHGRSKSCGCMTPKFKAEANMQYNLENKTINEWTVLKELGKGKILCRCSCGVEKICDKNSVMYERSKSCGHDTNKFVDMTNKKINDWTIKQEIGHGLVLCECSCGNTAVIQKVTVLNGKSKSCGCKKTELFTKTLMSKYGETTSNRAHNPREPWQIEAIQSKENMMQTIQKIFGEHKPTIQELMIELNIGEALTGRKVKEFDLYNYIEFQPHRSNKERELQAMIEESYSGEIRNSVRGIIGNNELDIYLPDLNLAFEFNGNYWHCSIFRDKYYHQSKTIQCAKQGIRLVHIFEYEWKDENKKSKLKNYIKTLVNNESSTRIYARNCKIVEVMHNDVYKFEEEHHLQGKGTSSINIGLEFENKLIGLMTFGKPRFNNNYEYELIRLCYDSEYQVIGGSEKMFKHFVSEYKPQSIISYCDLSKFNGRVYQQLGFNTPSNPITEPSYVWVYGNTCLSRYQTQKHKLIEKGIGTEDETEDQIMEDNDFIKIYDCGNLKFEWKA